MLLTKMTAEHAHMYHLPLALDKQQSQTLKVSSTSMAFLLLIHFRPISAIVWIEHKGENTYVAHVQPSHPQALHSQALSRKCCCPQKTSLISSLQQAVALQCNIQANMQKMELHLFAAISWFLIRILHVVNRSQFIYLNYYFIVQCTRSKLGTAGY